MRPQDAIRLSTEERATALLKVAFISSDPIRAIETISADPMAQGHAWRAIKLAIGRELPVRWQRRATAADRSAVLVRALAHASAPRHAHPGAVERLQAGTDRHVVLTRFALTPTDGPRFKLFPSAAEPFADDDCSDADTETIVSWRAPNVHAFAASCRRLPARQFSNGGRNE